MMMALSPTLKGAARPITTYHHIKHAPAPATSTSHKNQINSHICVTLVWCFPNVDESVEELLGTYSRTGTVQTERHDQGSAIEPFIIIIEPLGGRQGEEILCTDQVVD